MKRTYQTFYTVTYACLSVHTPAIKYFDDYASAKDFYNDTDRSDPPIKHTLSNPAEIKRYQDMIKDQEFLIWYTR